MIRQQSQITEAEDDSGDQHSVAETGENLHASLLNIMLACSKKYTTTYYCRFQCGNRVIM